jgi:hypothetical protein
LFFVPFREDKRFEKKQGAVPESTTPRRKERNSAKILNNIVYSIVHISLIYFDLVSAKLAI